MKKSLYTFLFVMFSSLLYSCDLDLQRSEDYLGTKLDIFQHMTCWEYLEKHPDEFKSMMKAIELCNMREYYIQKETRYTFLLLTEAAIANRVNEAIKNPSLIPSLEKLLRFHIIKGEYDAYHTLDYTIRYVDTLLDGEDLMSFSLQFGEPHAANRNDVDRLLIMKGCGSSEVITAKQSNLIMDNGPAHILDKVCIYIK